MKKILLASLFAAAFCLLTVFSAAAQTASSNQITKVQLSQAEIDRIVRSFTQKEAQFRDALRVYSFKREATIQTLGMGGQVSGEYRRDSHFVFADDGRRFERVLFAPMPTLTDIRITPEDLEDLNGVNQFPLEPSKAALYNFTFLGKEKIDELNLYVFDVSPKIMPDPKRTTERLFQGRIWVDDQDLMIVKSKGKGVPETKDNKFPIVEIWRENIGGKYWFPTYSYANDELYFEKSGQSVRMKMKINYKDYKEAQTTVKVLEGDEVIEEPTTPSAKPSPTPTKKP